MNYSILILRVITLFLLLANATASQGVVVLQYHHIDTGTPFSTSTSPTLFKQHIEYLMSNGFTVATLPSIVNKLKNNEYIADKTVSITFDDGFISVYTKAFPVLKGHNIPFTVFVNTDPIEAKRPSHVSWEQLEEMKKYGATIANHTHSHHYLIRENTSEKVWRERFVNEITTAQKLINKRLQQDVKLFAYPYGEFDQASIELLAEMGYMGFGQHSGAIGIDTNMQSMPRYPASNQYGKFPLIVTKLNSRAFESVEFEPYFGVIDGNSDNPPKLYIYGPEASLNSINCFGSSVGELPKVKINSTTLLISPMLPFSTRRFRYNCTSKHPSTDSFQWISVPWVDVSIDRI